MLIAYVAPEWIFIFTNDDFQWIAKMRNQTHALYIEYFNLEASPVNKMPSCVLPKNIIVDAKKLK